MWKLPTFILNSKILQFKCALETMRRSVWEIYFERCRLSTYHNILPSSYPELCRTQLLSQMVLDSLNISFSTQTLYQNMHMSFFFKSTYKFITHEMILIHLLNIYFSFPHQGVLAFDNTWINCSWWIYNHTLTSETGQH